MIEASPDVWKSPCAENDYFFCGIDEWPTPRPIGASCSLCFDELFSAHILSTTQRLVEQPRACVFGTKQPMINEVCSNELAANRLIRRSMFVCPVLHLSPDSPFGVLSIKSSHSGRPSPVPYQRMLCGPRQACLTRNRMSVYAPARPDKSLRDSRRPGAPRRRHRLYIPCRLFKSFFLPTVD